MGYMTPAEFEDKMRIILRDDDNDLEMFHVRADELMCEVLRGLGYEAGVKIFEEHKRWYA